LLPLSYILSVDYTGIYVSMILGQFGGSIVCHIAQLSGHIVYLCICMLNRNLI